MSLENADGRSPDKGSEKKSKVSYSREFLLSLSDLDICKKLPTGFDTSLLSEFEDASQSIPDRPRNSSLLSQGFRRHEYGSSPPTRGDSVSYSRSNYGKWESRSSGRSDRDSDSQSDRDSDSGKRFGPQNRRSWQTPEHDGLLGSGSFPRPSGYASGTSAPRVRTNEQNQLGKSNEPYHPPRPYKALPYSRRDTDSLNDETFGSSELASEDKSEEERRRRASFETMRKEQQKALQEKQKLNLEKHKVHGISDPYEVLDESKEEKGIVRNNELEVPAATSISVNDSDKLSFAPNSPAPRPLVPPGFRNNILGKSSGIKSQIHPPLSGIGKPKTTEIFLDPEAEFVLNGDKDGSERPSQQISLVNQQPSEKTQQIVGKGVNVKSLSSLDVPIKKLCMEDQLPHASGHLDSHKTLSDHEIVEVNTKVFEEKIVGDSNNSYSTSILEKIFGSSLSINDGRSGLAEHHDIKPDDTWSPSSGHSSKFAQWFVEEEAKAPDDVSSGRPNNLLSLLVSGDKGRYQVFDTEATGQLPHGFSSKSSEKINKTTSEMTSASNGVSNQARISVKEEAVPPILTCEDLEQSILSEYNPSSTIMRPLVKTSSGIGPNIEKSSSNVDGHASVHLLSLLQKGTNHTNMTPDSGVCIQLVDKLLPSQENNVGTPFNEAIGEENSKNIPNSGNTLTLETLFGTAFMNELQSVKAPVSVQRGSNEFDAPNPQKLPFQLTGNDISSATTNKNELHQPSHDYNGLPSDNRQQTKLSKTENWLNFDDSQIEIRSSKNHIGAVPKHGGSEVVPEFQLPEEENLLFRGDRRNHQMSTFLRTGNSSSNIKVSSDAPIDIMEKLAAFNVVKDERVMAGRESLPFTRGLHEQVEAEIPFRNLLVPPHSPQFQPPQMTQIRPLYNHMESHPSHLSSQMKFLGREPSLSHDPPANHQFSSNIIGPSFHQSTGGAAGYGIPPHHSVLHHMQMSGNHPPHMLPDFPGSGPPSHHGLQATGLIHEMNQMQGFPMGPRQPNFGHRGVPMPGPNVNSGSNPPEAFQRLVEMEIRANSKQIHPFAPGHNPGVYGHEVDMGLRYR